MSRRPACLYRWSVVVVLVSADGCCRSFGRRSAALGVAPAARARLVGVQLRAADVADLHGREHGTYDEALHRESFHWFLWRAPPELQLRRRRCRLTGRFERPRPPDRHRPRTCAEPAPAGHRVRSAPGPTRRTTAAGSDPSTHRASGTAPVQHHTRHGSSSHVTPPISHATPTAAEQRTSTARGTQGPHPPAVERGHRATSPASAEALTSTFSGIATSPPSASEQPKEGPSCLTPGHPGSTRETVPLFAKSS